ncbi:MAG: TetR/AcrR family transcriptional regulator [Deltaproteobacteria bacterium]|nr:TetR/AcrR family transcriptional regulator [Deltaproteobacteria bacterium]
MPRPANPTLRDDILAAALRLVEEKGTTGLTMREVAGALGYSATAIYQHFDSKEALLLALQLQAGDLLTMEMEEARQEPTLEAQLQAMGQRYLQFGLNNAAYYRLIFQDSVPGLSLTPEQLTRMRHSWAIMRETLSAWVKARGLQGLDVDQEANVLWAMAHGITSLALADRLPSTNQTEIFALWHMAAARWATGVLSLQPSQLQMSEQKPVRRKKTVAVRRPRRSRSNS